MAIEQFSTIQDVCTKLAVTQRALRYYESRGLVRPKRFGTHRHYSSADIDRIESILKLKSFGFSLAKISSILASPSDGPFGLSVLHCAEQIAYLQDQLVIVNNAIAELEKACPTQSQGPALPEPLRIGPWPA
jgi:DNA-binding transcriptional MerR regulator